MESAYHSLNQNTSLETFKEEESNINKQYNKYDVRQDPRFGETIIYKNKMGILFCSLTFQIFHHSKREYQRFNRFCKFRKNLEHKYLLPLMHYYENEYEDYTIKYWKFQLMFEYPNNDLKLELRCRKMHEIKFRIEELWKIAKGNLNNLI